MLFVGEQEKDALFTKPNEQTLPQELPDLRIHVHCRLYRAYDLLRYLLLSKCCCVCWSRFLSQLNQYFVPVLVCWSMNRTRHHRRTR
jgi:hypothetical protein